jgi:hypothetical protein
MKAADVAAFTFADHLARAVVPLPLVLQLERVVPATVSRHR